MIKFKKPLIISVSVVLLAAAVVALLVYNGVILLNNPSLEQYPVRGIDVSSYQGVIDWELLASQDIYFVFIKATEGSSFKDKNFAYNYTEAQKTNLSVGAYHFFSYDSSGITQAENFISAVHPFSGMLPPVIDLEFYGDYNSSPPPKEDVTVQLNAMIGKLYEYYGLKPIMYATEESYKLYLAGGYGEYDIWIRNVISSPELSDERSWTFWQFTNRARLNGYDGEEKYIDINVFNGSLEEFEQYPRYKNTIIY